MEGDWNCCQEMNARIRNSDLVDGDLRNWIEKKGKKKERKASGCCRDQR